MNTLIFCTSILNNNTIFTYAEWWKYYRAKFPDATFLLVNDGKVEQHVFDELQKLTKYEFNKSNLIEFDDKLGRMIIITGAGGGRFAQHCCMAGIISIKFFTLNATL